jgi:hypothetical protein
MVLGGIFLGEAWPTGLAVWGACLGVAGIGAFAWMVSRPSRVPVVCPVEPHA